MSLVYITPLYWMVATSLKSSLELTSFPPTIFPHTFVWKNYIDALEYIPFYTVLFQFPYPYHGGYHRRGYF